MSRHPRPFRPYENRGPAINDRIRARQVLLIDEKNEKVGVVETIEALRRAHTAGLDLVEVSSESTPPVCRILDFGKYKYEQAKKDKASKSKSKAGEMKEVRLGRSMKIDPHDVGIRINQAHGFLLEGHKVLIVQNFRGRELQHKHLGDARMRHIIERLADVSRIETPPRLAGRRMTMILAPDKAKIDAIAKKQGTKAPGKTTAGEGEADGRAGSAKDAPPESQAPPTEGPKSRAPSRERKSRAGAGKPDASADATPEQAALSSSSAA